MGEVLLVAGVMFLAIMGLTLLGAFGDEWKQE